MSPTPEYSHLWIVRHGQAEPYRADDDSRCLTDIGAAQVRITAQRIALSGLKPDLMAYSPLVRTSQTAQCLQDVLQIDTLQVWPELVHSSQPSLVEDRLRNCGSRRVLLVSHMPLVAMLESYLIGVDQDLGFGFETAELSELSSVDPYPGNWHIERRAKP